MRDFKTEPGKAWGSLGLCFARDILWLKEWKGILNKNKKTVDFQSYICYNIFCFGVWRSLVARTAGGREVAGSNPVAPINAVKSRVCGLSILMKNRKSIKTAINCIQKLFSLKREDAFVHVIILYGYLNEFMSYYHGLFLMQNQYCHKLISSKINCTSCQS